MSPMTEDVDSMKGVVADILEKYPMTRSDDEYLIVKVLEALGYAEFDLSKEEFVIRLGKEDIFDEMPVFESITRIRRKFQQNGKFEAPDWVREKRLDQAFEMRKKMVKESL